MAPLYSLGLKISSGTLAGLQHHLLPPHPHHLAIRKHNQVSHLSCPVSPLYSHILPTETHTPQFTTASDLLPRQIRFLNREGAKPSAVLQLFSSFLTPSSLRPHHREGCLTTGKASPPAFTLGAFRLSSEPQTRPPAPAEREGPGAPPGPTRGPDGVPREKPSALQSGAEGKRSPSQAASGPTPSCRLPPHDRAAPRRR